MEEVEVSVFEEEPCSVVTDVRQGGVWRLRKVPAGESQDRFLGFRNTAMLSSTNSSFPFAKQLLA